MGVANAIGRYEERLRPYVERIQKLPPGVPQLAYPALRARSFGKTLATRHRKNWRERVASRLETLTEEELAFTAPLALSEKDVGQIRALLLEAIGNVSKIVEESPAERLACLNIDLVFVDG